MEPCAQLSVKGRWRWGLHLSARCSAALASRYYEDLQQRVPRAEMERIQAVLRDATVHVLAQLTGAL